MGVSYNLRSTLGLSHRNRNIDGKKRKLRVHLHCILAGDQNLEGEKSNYAVHKESCLEPKHANYAVHKARCLEPKHNKKAWYELSFWAQILFMTSKNTRVAGFNCTDHSSVFWISWTILEVFRVNNIGCVPPNRGADKQILGASNSGASHKELAMWEAGWPHIEAYNLKGLSLWLVNWHAKAKTNRELQSLEIERQVWGDERDARDEDILPLGTSCEDGGLNHMGASCSWQSVWCHCRGW